MMRFFNRTADLNYTSLAYLDVLSEFREMITDLIATIEEEYGLVADVDEVRDATP